MSNKDSLISQFLVESKKTDFKFSFSEKIKVNYEPLTNDALFHIPLISVAVLVLAKEAKEGVNTGEIGRLVGVIIEETIPGFKSSSQYLGWSSTLRHRTAEAVAFLEQFSFILVSAERVISVTAEGSKFVLNLRKEQSDIGQAVRGFYMNASTSLEEVRKLL